MSLLPSKAKTATFIFNVEKIDQLIEEYESLSSLRLEVGVFAPSRKEIAARHEYGEGFIPQRSFIRSAWFENKNLEFEMIIEILNHIYASQNKTWVGEVRLKQFALRKLSELGQKMVYYMQVKILRRIPPPLKPATIKAKRRKGSAFPTIPLVDTGNMYQFINYRLRDKGRFTKKYE